MILSLHENLQKPLVIKATRLLVTADDGTPIAFGVQYGPQHWRFFHAGDPDFAEQLRMHGFNHTVVVNHMDFNRKKDS